MHICRFREYYENYSSTSDVLFQYPITLSNICWALTTNLSQLLKRPVIELSD